MKKQVLTLAHLLSLGCGQCPIGITTASLGKALEISQQAASNNLTDLERNGMIERVVDGRGYRVLVTRRGYEEVEKVSRQLLAALNPIRCQITLDGRVESGMGEGAYYISREGYMRQFQSVLNMAPFPGTLNIRLDTPSIHCMTMLDTSAGLLIRGFADENRTFGWVRCYGAILEPDIPCHLIQAERTHHDAHVIELISDVNLRDRATVEDGDAVRVQVSV